MSGMPTTSLQDWGGVFIFVALAVVLLIAALLVVMTHIKYFGRISARQVAKVARLFLFEFLWQFIAMIAGGALLLWIFG